MPWASSRVRHRTGPTTPTDSAGSPGEAHTWSARWAGDGVVVACDGVVVFTSTRVLAYPLQLMAGLFEIGPRNAGDSSARTAVVHSLTAT